MPLKFHPRVSVTAAAIAMALAGGAHATDDLFTVTEISLIPENSVTMTFTLPASPTVDAANTHLGLNFVVDSVTIIYNKSTYTDDGVDFYNINNYGGMSDYGYNLFAGFGPQQFYSGSEFSPTFITGTYSDQFDYATDLFATLTITSVPEPTTWTLMLAGFGALGGVLRARRRTAPATA
jgi:hypothetical protein